MAKVSCSLTTAYGQGYQDQDGHRSSGVSLNNWKAGSGGEARSLLFPTLNAMEHEEWSVLTRLPVLPVTADTSAHAHEPMRVDLNHRDQRRGLLCGT